MARPIVPERHGLPGQSAVRHSVHRRHQRTERFQQRRDRSCATRSRSTSSSSARTNGTPRANLTLNYGLRYEYYTPLEVEDDLIVKFNIDTGQIDPNTTQLHGSKKNNFQPRVSMTYAPGKTVFRSGFGIFVGPGQGEDLIQPIESDRVNTTLSTGPFLAYPINQDLLVANFTSNPNNRNYQPRAYAAEYAIPEKVYQYTASVQQELGGASARPWHTSAARGAICSCAASPTRSRRSSPTRTRPRGVRDSRVLDRRRVTRRQRHWRAEPVRRGRLQDQRRPRPLQRDDALAESPLGAGPCDEHAVHARQEPRYVGRLERGEHGGEQRADRGGVRVRRRLQQLRRPPHVQRQPAVFAAVRRGPEVGKQCERPLQSGARRLGRGRHRQRAQRRADQRARHAAGHPLSRHGERPLLHGSGSRSCCGDQHARWRCVAQRAASRRRARRRSFIKDGA